MSDSLKSEVLKHRLLALIPHYYPEDPYCVQARLVAELCEGLSYYETMAKSRPEGRITPLEPTSTDFLTPR